MTREHKLVLILGFAVFLVVAVLISDHFSSAHLDRLGSGALAGTPGAFGVDPVGTWETGPERPLVRTTEPMQEREERRVPDPVFERERPAVDPLEIVMHPQSQLPPPVVTPGSVSGVTDPLAGGAQDAARWVSDQLSGRRGGDRTRDESPVGGSTTPEQKGREASPTMPRVSTVADRTHVVNKNENLTRICERYYGDGGLWRKLALYNKGRVEEDGGVRYGVAIKIPAKEVLLGEAAPASPGSGAGSAQAPAAKKPAQGYASYTVQKGDYLGRISSRLLGTSTRWREIYELNEDVIDDPDNLIAGVTLRIPAR